MPEQHRCRTVRRDNQMREATGDEDYYCHCGTKLGYLPRWNAWCCPTHSLADHVYDAEGQRL